jgi:hypothetical protein
MPKYDKAWHIYHSDFVEKSNESPAIASLVAMPTLPSPTLTMATLVAM